MEIKKRAKEDWAFIRQIADATLAPRTMLLKNFGEFLQAASVIYRLRLAAFRKCLWDNMFAMKNSLRGRLEYSPNKTDATFGEANFRKAAPGAIEEKFQSGLGVLRVKLAVQSMVG